MNMITPTESIATKATNGNIMKIILIRFRFLVCAIQQTLHDVLLLRVCEKQLCIQKVAVLYQDQIQNFSSSFELAQKCIQASQFHPINKCVIIFNYFCCRKFNSPDICWETRFQYLRVQISQVVAVYVQLLSTMQQSNGFLGDNFEISYMKS